MFLFWFNLLLLQTSHWAKIVRFHIVGNFTKAINPDLRENRKFVRRHVRRWNVERLCETIRFCDKIFLCCCRCNITFMLHGAWQRTLLAGWKWLLFFSRFFFILVSWNYAVSNFDIIISCLKIAAELSFSSCFLLFLFWILISSWSIHWFFNYGGSVLRRWAWCILLIHGVVVRTTDQITFRLT